MNCGQGNTEFKNEVLIATKLQHPNVVKLLGFCMEGLLDRLLVHEFVHNKIFDYLILGKFNLNVCIIGPYL